MCLFFLSFPTKQRDNQFEEEPPEVTGPDMAQEHMHTDAVMDPAALQAALDEDRLSRRYVYDDVTYVYDDVTCWMKIALVDGMSMMM
jgi:hypothetical protein